MPIPALAESGAEREQLLRQEYLSQTARINWHDLQVYYARGAVIAVQAGCDLIEVAVQIGMDNSADIEQRIHSGEVAGVSEEQALQWYADNPELWAVVAAPWVLVQERVT